MTIQFGLIVIRSPQPDVVAAFYRLLGIDFVKEKHGKGPEHFAGKVDQAVFEIYPLNKGTAVELGSRIGFTVPKLEELMKSLRSEGVVIIEEAKQSDWGYRAVVRDPDGRSVELQQLR
jgi:catechol 2,3-dioxygenase-like lactoylglutathione lyase family enzyme